MKTLTILAIFLTLLNTLEESLFLLIQDNTFILFKILSIGGFLLVLYLTAYLTIEVCSHIYKTELQKYFKRK